MTLVKRKFSADELQIFIQTFRLLLDKDQLEICYPVTPFTHPKQLFQAKPNLIFEIDGKVRLTFLPYYDVVT